MVAVDGTAASIAAVDAAIDHAIAVGGELMFVHASSEVADELYCHFCYESPSLAEVLERDDVLRGAVRQAEDRGVPAHAEVIGDYRSSGDLAADIAGLAAGLGASMIVVGSRGRGPAAGAAFGSVSQNLIRYTDIPVLVVRKHELHKTALAA